MPCRYCTLTCRRRDLARHEAQCVYRPRGILNNAGARVVATTGPRVQPQAATFNATPAPTSTATPAVQATPAAPTVPTIPPPQVVIASASSTSSAQVHSGSGTAHANQTSSAPNTQAPPSAATGATVQSQAVPPSAPPAMPAMPPQQVAVPSASSTSSAQVHSGTGTAHANQTSSAPNTQALPSAATGLTVQPPAVTSNLGPAVPTAPSIPAQQMAIPSASSTSSAQVHCGPGPHHNTPRNCSSCAKGLRIVRTTFACAAMEILRR